MTDQTSHPSFLGCSGGARADVPRRGVDGVGLGVLHVRAAGPRPETLAKIRKLLRDNPGAVVRGKPGEDGRVRYTVERPNRRASTIAELQGHVRLAELKREAEVRYREAVG